MTTSSVRSTIRKVTPEQAQKWLASNTHNRHIAGKRVDAIARDITEGRWILNGEPIQFGTGSAGEEVLLNGQHRLAAIVKAGTAVESLVITGLSVDAQDTIDIGRPRSFGDVLRIRGESYALETAAITRRACLWSKGLIAANSVLSVPETEAFLEANPDIREAAVVAALSRKTVAAPGSIVGTAFWICQRVDHLDAKTFFIDQVINGIGLKVGDPARALNYRLNEEAKTGRRGLVELDCLAYILRAWNAYRTGENLQAVIRPRGGWTSANIPTPK